MGTPSSLLVLLHCACGGGISKERNKASCLSSSSKRVPGFHGRARVSKAICKPNNLSVLLHCACRGGISEKSNEAKLS